MLYTTSIFAHNIEMAQKTLKILYPYPTSRLDLSADFLVLIFLILRIIDRGQDHNSKKKKN